MNHRMKIKFCFLKSLLSPSSPIFPSPIHLDARRTDDYELKWDEDVQCSGRQQQQEYLVASGLFSSHSSIHSSPTIAAHLVTQSHSISLLTARNYSLLLLVGLRVTHATSSRLISDRSSTSTTSTKMNEDLYFKSSNRNFRIPFPATLFFLHPHLVSCTLLHAMDGEEGAR